MSDPTFLPEEVALVDRSRVAHVATVGDDGAPHVVPVCPALDEGTILFATAKDRKIRDLRNDPRISICFDQYTEDWNSLLQVLVTGSSDIAEHGTQWTRGRDLLYGKFPQYEPEAQIIESQTVIVLVRPTKVASTWRHRARTD